MTSLPDGDVGVLFERGAYEELVFVRVSGCEIASALKTSADDPPLDGPAAAAVANLGPLKSDRWGSDEVLDKPAGSLTIQVVPRSITPAPPHDWEFCEEHVTLEDVATQTGTDSGTAAVSIAHSSARRPDIPDSEGKEIGQAGAQVVATRSDIARNLGPAAGDIDAGDIISLSATGTWSGTRPVKVTPLWRADGATAGASVELNPGESHTWRHLSRPYGNADVTLRWCLEVISRR